MLHALSSTPLMCLDAVVLDTETTGLDTEIARIIQIGAVRVIKGKLDENASFEILINPGLPIPPETTKIHGLSDADVANAPSFAEAAAEADLFLGGAVIIGHNITFDLLISAKEYGRHGLIWNSPRALCTALLARVANPGLHDFSLDNVCRWLGVEIDGRHTALGDAIGTAKVYTKLIPYLVEKGVRTLAEAESVCRRFADDEAAKIRGNGLGWSVSSQHVRQEPYARVDSFPFRHRVNEVMGAPAVTVAPSASVREVAKILADRRISSVFVTPEAGAANYGVITERDVMRLVALDEPPTSLTAADIMSQPLLTVPDEAFLYKALATMARAKFRHLGVHNSDGELVGALTTGNLLRQRANDALVLGDEIERAESVADLAGIWARVPLVARSMLSEGVGVRNIAAIVAEETCALTRRAFEMAEARLFIEGKGPPPRPYAVLVLGSGGRGETLLAPDQDNGLVYGGDHFDESVDAWFEAMGSYAADILNEAGLPYCNGGVMAKNKQWRHNLAGWKETIQGWALRGEGKDLLHVDIFYDFRAVHGDFTLAQELRRFASESAFKSPPLLRKMAALVEDLDPPTGVFGGILTKQGRADVKKTGLLAIVSGARILALRHGIEKVGTKDRLDAFRELGIGNKEDLLNIVHAHEVILSEDLRQQLEDIEAGIPPTNKVGIKRLSARRKSELKWALEQVEIVKYLTKDAVS